MRRNDRFFWILTGAFFLVFTVALTFAPRVIADTAKNDTQEYLRMLDYLFMLVKNNYVEDIPAEKLYEGAVKGLFESLGDPHSVYLSPEDMKDFTDTTVGEYGGIGLYISKPNQKEDTEPVTPPFVEVKAPSWTAPRPTEPESTWETSSSRSAGCPRLILRWMRCSTG
jgi:carboxyl-terminal processing protease